MLRIDRGMLRDAACHDNYEALAGAGTIIQLITRNAIDAFCHLGLYVSTYGSYRITMENDPEFSEMRISYDLRKNIGHVIPNVRNVKISKREDYEFKIEDETIYSVISDRIEILNRVSKALHDGALEGVGDPVHVTSNSCGERYLRYEEYLLPDGEIIDGYGKLDQIWPYFRAMLES